MTELVNAVVTADGNVVIMLADVELIRLDPHLVLSSIGIPSAARDSILPMITPAGNGLAGLVLAVVDLIRRLLECQALRRMEAGTLTGEEVEQLGKSLMSLEEQTRRLAMILKDL